jgi:hypothetical protein
MIAPAIPAFLNRLTLGPPRTSGRITVFPLLGTPASDPDYITLAEALQGQLAEVTEVNQGGSVPDLAVVNRASKPVLLLDGEELAGARQNRVLNTTILIAALSKTTIPVSCSEHGRWHYTSATFSSSGNLLAAKIRKSKSRSVSDSLKSTGHFHSDQGEVWNEIAALHEKTGTTHTAKTQAMSDAYAAKAKDLESLAGNFPVIEGQMGLVFLQDGRVEGCDVLSRPEAYRQVHDRLVRSYAMSALVEEQVAQACPEPLEPRVMEFLKGVETCEATTHASPGLGEDHRVTNGRVAGSALVVEGQVVHMALFAQDPRGDTEPGSIASLAQRRRYRGL